MTNHVSEFSSEAFDQIILNELERIARFDYFSYRYEINMKLETLPTHILNQLKNDRMFLTSKKVDRKEIMTSINRLSSSGKITIKLLQSEELQRTGWFSKDWFPICLIKICLPELKG